MIDLEVLMGKDRYEAFMRGVVRGKYHVLLGAGASQGATDSEGAALPLGASLSSEIVSTFDIAGAEYANLRRVYSAARTKVSSTGESMPEFLQRRFLRTVPSNWMSDFCQFSWAYIWTLNIDDCLERAYANTAGARQKLLSISWTERHRTPRSGQDEVLLIHLHGKAARASREDELVFDISAYLKASQPQHRWHSLFGDYYPSEPFLVLGASLDEEIDIQSILEQGHLNASAKEPSVIVNKTITPLAADEYRSYGLVPIEATVDELFAAIKQNLGRFVSEISVDESNQLSQVSQEVISFLGQWTRLDDTTAVHSDDRHDVYAGHEPEWSDVRNELIANRAIVPAIAADLTKLLSPGRSELILMTGGIFSGKTGALLTLAQRLLDLRFQPYIYSASVTLEVGAVVWWLQHYPRTVLLVDNAYDFALDVAKLMSAVETANLSARVLLVEREGRAKSVEYELDSVDWKKRRLGDALTDNEIVALIEKLTKNYRAGDLTTMNDGQRFQYFVGHNRQLFSAMAALERGRGFEARVKDEYAAITDDRSRQLVCLASLGSYLGYGIPLSVVPRATGLTVSEIEELASSINISDLLFIKGTSIQPRHRVFATLLIEMCLSKDERFDIAVALAEAIAPHVSPAAIGERSTYYRLARALMSHTLLAEMFEMDHDRVLKWFRQVEKNFDWNARFWEQRALAASAAGRHEPAYSWAKQAVRVREDSYTLNTVGTVLMRRALSEASATSWPAESWEAAELSLREARSSANSESGYPFETFFTYTVRLLESVQVRDDAVDQQLAITWLQWCTSALMLEGASRSRILETLASFQPRFDQAMAEGPG